MTELEEFNQQLIADVQGDADAVGVITSEAFFEKVGDLLTEAGELDSANRSYHEGRYGRGSIQIDGYGGDPRDADGVLSVILCDFSIKHEIRVQNTEQIKQHLNRLYRFVEASLKREFRDQLEETSSGFGIADLINATWKHVEKIKLIIITNGDFRARADAAKVNELDGKPVTLSVWDLKRLKQFMEQGETRASLSINFKNDFGGGIPMLEASGDGSTFDSYLAVIPGKQLAEIYEKWGPRLLEANVRSFLQARGKVNKGIRDTIKEDPKMFFSYNNGLSATAEAIETEQTDKGLVLVQAENLQIVNGGQTTASLHAARKIFPDQLGMVRVQMKLTIVPKEQSEFVVPKVSEFANSQNKVNAADFFANHPFHIRIEELSRRILAPSGSDGYRETKWFYERARGQFADERGRRTPAERKKFDAEFPRAQFLTKTDLAKYENTWSCVPHTVSLGAQKNFAEFAKNIGTRWGTEGASFDELWFRHLVAKAIIFKSTEQLVSNADWYEGGYRANIVTYAISKLVHDASQLKMAVDLSAVWRQQSTSNNLDQNLLAAAKAAQDVITHPPEGIRNFSEWAKKQACWKRLEDKKVQYPDSFESILISKETEKAEVTEARADKTLNDSIFDQTTVITLGSDFWKEARNWARERGLLSPRERGVLDVCAAIPNRMPTEKQCTVAMAALSKLEVSGFSNPVIS